jgi:hypothetical protein
MMSNPGSLMLVRKNIYISSLKALYVYLEDLTDAYVEAKKTLGEDEEHFLDSLKDQIQVISNIAEALSAAAAPPNSDPTTAN